MSAETLSGDLVFAVYPLNKDFSRLFQIRLDGYDQWQVSSNGGRGILVDGTVELVQGLGS